MKIRWLSIFLILTLIFAQVQEHKQIPGQEQTQSEGGEQKENPEPTQPKQEQTQPEGSEKKETKPGNQPVISVFKPIGRIINKGHHKACLSDCYGLRLKPMNRSHAEKYGSNPVGFTYFDKDSTAYFMWTGSQWVKIGGANSGASAPATGSGQMVFRDTQNTNVFEIPPGVDMIYVTAIAGGGGGGGSSSDSSGYCGGGGGSGEIVWEKALYVSSSEKLFVVVGAGGEGGAPGANGNDGGNSIICTSKGDTLLVVHGGKGGGAATSTSHGYGGHSGDEVPLSFGSDGLAGGTGGFVYPFGKGGPGGDPNGGNGGHGSGYGAGGGGGRGYIEKVGQPAHGGRGADGIVIIEW